MRRSAVSVFLQAFLLLLSVVIFSTRLHAQKRVFARVEPNAETVNRSAEVYDPLSGAFAAAAGMSCARSGHVAVPLAGRKTLIAGGYNGGYISLAETYDPSSGKFAYTGIMAAARAEFTATLLMSGKVLLAGGYNGSTSLNSAETYDPAAGVFESLTATLVSARQGHTATLLPSGKILLAGGWDGSQYLRVSSKQGLFQTEYFGSAKTGAMLNGIEVGDYAGVNRLYAPQVANTDMFKTRLNLINANPVADATVTLTWFTEYGPPLCAPVTLLLPRNAQIKDDLARLFGYDVATRNASGYLQVESATDRIVGTVTYVNPHGEFLTSAVLPLASNRFAFPLAAEDDTYQTGFALLNSNDDAAHVTLELWKPDGTLDRSTSFSLAGRARTALYLRDDFPGLEARTTGNVRVRSDRPLHALSLVNDRELHFVAAVPAIPYPD